jgi:CMP-N-acetylneuraminic acid synthetase
LIPARGGSKGVLRKNVATLGDRPLIAWTIDAALKAACFDRVVVSTDDEEIAGVARRFGAEVPFLRPSEFSDDTSSALGVIAHAHKHFLAMGKPFDAIAYLQPTSPFRTAANLSEAYRQFLDARPDTLVSVVVVPHNMSSSSLMRPLGDSGTLWLHSPHGQTMRRQEKEALFARNGPAILIVSARDVIERDRLYGERVLGFEMDRLSSFDIDDPIDLEMARCLLPLVVERHP